MALFMLVNCQEELDVITKSSEQYKISAKTHTLLYGKEALEKRNILINNLKKEGGKGLSALRKTIMGSNTTMRTNMEDIESLIDYSEVYQIDQGNGVIHYTYMLNHPDTSDEKFFNIVLKTYGDLEKVIMVTYNLEKEFSVDYNLNGDFTKFTGTIDFETVTFESGFPCDEEPHIPPPVTDGSAGGGSGGGGGTHGTGTGTGNGGNPYNQGLVDAKYLALSIHVSTPASANGDENEGEDPEDGGEHWDLVSKSPRYFRTGFSLDPTNPCGDEEEIGIIEPDHIKNCEGLKKQSQNPDFQAKMSDLTNKAAVQNFESAYTMYQNASTGLVFSSEATGTATAPEVALNLSQSTTETSLNCIGFMHCHLDNGSTFTIFSFSDLIALASLATVSTRNKEELAVYLTTSSGTFALKIDDRVALKNNLNRMALGQNGYEKDFDSYVKKTMPHEEQVKGFLKFITEQFSDTGLGASLYEQDTNGDWEKLTLNSTGKKINRKKC